ncbi:SAV_2336 N-terminal domain-related protein [Streptomyces sp. DG2A-72]|uniref:SAV_2336 N-terminal domain-related protein n=1 Tax=Streptomyces sp. DG2A-72 TaxID=3051386 RepID=UPI00265BFE6B|nr:SAV_2336 N-terminal domain-related protein [Streptomyces sp. DG2A-72]MDO0932892.1 SAV_2336 N-terminal domain-related protein [Streptomyces sp. DG2A-72]
MPSERPGPRTPLRRLADMLAEASGGPQPTPLELAELLWLARHMEPPAESPAAPAARAPADVVRPPAAATKAPPPFPSGQQNIGEPSAPPPSPRAPLHLPAPEPAPATKPQVTAEPHTTLLAPAPPMLRHPLALQRSLRPLKRRTDAPDRLELDERATADRIARLGAAPEWWLPVLRPARERWLRLNLVYDTGPTMPVWRPLIRELHTALVQSGIFRTVTLHRAHPDGTVRSLPGDGRTVTLLVSDCMGPQWRQGPAGTRWFGTLARWAHRMPLAVVQPLPEHLWRDTALPSTPGRLSAPHPAAPAASLAFTPYDGALDEPDGTGTVPLPVLEPGARWLANWAALVAAPGGQEFPGSAARLGGPLPAASDNRTDITGLSAEDLVLRFRATASPQAFRLAGHLALGRPDLPVMRLVQAAVEPHPRPQHLAEVILSGMLTAVPGPPGSYAFRPGVGELLLRGLPRTARGRTAELLARVGGLIDERAGVAPGEFRASTPAAGGTPTVVDGEAFATVTTESVRQLTGGGAGTSGSVPPVLAGRYRMLGLFRPDGTLWRAHDTEADRTVVIRRQRPVTDPERREAFLREARILKGIDHPGVVTVHDFGIEDGTPYVVMEHLDGIPLNAMAAVGGYELPYPLLVSIGTQLARALLTCHMSGITHGGLEMGRVVLLPDGTVKLSHFTPGRTAGPQVRAEDLRALAELLLELAAATAWLTRPVHPDQLIHLPSSLRPQFADAIDRLLSQVLNTQMEGLEQLISPDLAPAAREAYEQRFHYVLGPLHVEGPTGDIPIPPDLRPMLAMLLLRHGRKVTHDELAAGVWGPGEAPQDTVAELGRQASELRALLGPGTLAVQPDGYALHTSADFVDLIECERLVERLVARTPRNRADYDRALKLWRSGEPLAGVPGPAAHTARAQLQQLRLGLYRSRAELDLERGEFERVETDLAELLRAHPAREDFRRLYIIALRRQGRTEEALEAYEEYEVSGGLNPELRTLGHELREELERFDDAPEGGYEEPAADSTVTDYLLGYAAAAEEQPPEEPSEEPLPQEDVPVDPRDELPPEAFGNEGDEPDVDPRDCAAFEFVDGPPSDEALEDLRRLVTILLTVSGLDSYQYELREFRTGFTVLTAPYLDTAPLFRATVAGLPELLERLDGRRLRVEFWQAWFRREGSEGGSDRPAAEAVTAALDASGARAVLAFSDFWHQVEVDENPDADPGLFEPLGDGTGWYRAVRPDEVREAPAADAVVDVSGTAYDMVTASTAPVVRGPFPMPADWGLVRAERASEAVVLSLPGGELVPLDSSLARFAPDHVRATWSYFTVDLAERGLTPDAVPGVEVRWSVNDPVKAASNPGLDLPGLLTETLLGARGLYGDGLREALARTKVPGYGIRWILPAEVQSAPLGTRPDRSRPANTSSALIAGADAVILAFDDVLARMFPAGAEREVLRDVARLISEERDPEDALTGQPLLPGGGPVPPLEGHANSLDLLRAFAGHGLAQEVRRRIDRHEARAAATARPTPLADQLVSALRAGDVPLAVVTDRAPEPVRKHLNRRGLTRHLAGGVHGRGTDLALLMPHPHVLQQALDRLGVPAARCVMIGSTVAERAAARAVGLPFIGFCPDDQTRRRLRAADAETPLVTSLRTLMTAARYR